MNAWIKKIHMYAGLLNFTILCVFGLAGVIVTADAPDIFHAGNEPATAIVPFAAPSAASDKDVADLMVRQVGPRHTGKPSIRRDAEHRLVADNYSVNGLVRLTLLEPQGQMKIETYRNSIWRFIDNAHATTLQESTTTWAPNAWAWYIEIAIWSLLLMALSGLWLGLVTRWNYWWTKAALIAGTISFALFCVVLK